MRAAPLLLAAAVLLAGCSGDAPRPGAADDAGAPGQGDTQASGPAADASAAPEDATLATPLRIEGSTAAGGCVAAGPQEACHYELDDSAFHVVDAPGRPLRLRGNLSWDAMSPASQTLTLYVPAVVDGEFVWEPGDPAASGTSPLAFDLDLASLGDATAGLVVGNGVVAPFAAGYAAVQAPQAFTLEAVYVSAYVSAAAAA